MESNKSAKSRFLNEFIQRRSILMDRFNWFFFFGISSIVSSYWSKELNRTHDVSIGKWPPISKKFRIPLMLKHYHMDYWQMHVIGYYDWLCIKNTSTGFYGPRSSSTKLGSTREATSLFTDQAGDCLCTLNSCLTHWLWLGKFICSSTFVAVEVWLLCKQ
jgi:hypothetical protein